MIIGYTRVSTGKQDLSLSLQEKKINQYAELQDLELNNIILDNGMSAKTFDRPGIKQIIELIKAKQVKIIIIYKLDRLTRSIKDLNEFIELTLKYNVSLVSIQDSINTQTATGRLIINVLGSVSQWEREVIAERTSEALQEKKRQGKKYTNIAPYGYKWENKTLVKNEAEQKIIKQVFKLKKNGLSLQKIANKLNEKNTLKRINTAWKKSDIQNLIKKAS